MLFRSLLISIPEIFNFSLKWFLINIYFFNKLYIPSAEKVSEDESVANYNNWKHPGLHTRLSVAIYEINRYRRNHDPNGGSLSQRLEYTKTSLYLIRQHPVFGVGTGDVPDAFRQAYDELQSPLLPQFRHRAHNQYLAITIGFGIVGLISVDRKSVV